MQRTDQAFRSCCWSDNPRWTAVEEAIFEANCHRFGITPSRPWLCGHRKVEGALYRSQCGGKVIQINPQDSAPRVYILAPPREFDPRRDVRRLK